MPLRFAQSLLLTDSGAPEATGHSIVSPSLFWGDPAVAGVKPRTPAWLGGKFRPRNLTPEGQALLERMEPDSVLRDGPVDPVPAKDWGSLRERMAYLQRKYILLDMLRRGFACESGGRYWPFQLAAQAREDQANGHERRKGGDRRDGGRGPGRDRRKAEDDADAPLVLSVEAILGWMAVFREPTYDQLRALHPNRKGEVDRALQQMVKAGLIVEHSLPFGESDLTVLRMTDAGIASFRAAHEDWKGLALRGIAPRQSGQSYVYHEQAVGDALGYFMQEVQTLGGVVTGVLLEAGLRRLFNGHQHVPDLRVEFELDGASRHWDVEVIGLGHSHESTALRYLEDLGDSMRGFDPLARRVACRRRHGAAVR